MYNKRNTGFSLIELITVIGIISLLSALIFPALSGVKKRAQQTTCLSRLHQIGLAANLYLDDYDGKYPYAVNRYSQELGLSVVPDPVLISLPVYPILLTPYVKSSSVFECPGDIGFYNKNNSAFKAWGSSYFYNENLMFSPENAFAAFGTDATKVPLLQDAIGIWHGDAMDTPTASQRINVLFVDLHVKRVNFLDTVSVGID